MRLLFGALIVTLSVALPATAKRADFFSLDVRPGATHQADVCGKRTAATEVATGSSVAATVALRHTSRSATPFVISVRRCVAGRFRTSRRIEVPVAAKRRSVTTHVRLARSGEYRIEALLNGDRPSPASAIRHVVVSAAPEPRLLSVQYGYFRLTGASSGYNALKLRTLDPDGQVVGVQWEQLDPPQDPHGVGIADGGCQLAARRDGEIGTFHLPMTLAPGHYRYEFELTSVSCGADRQPRDDRQPQTVRQTIAFDVP